MGYIAPALSIPNRDERVKCQSQFFETYMANGRNNDNRDNDDRAEQDTERNNYNSNDGTGDVDGNVRSGYILPYSHEKWLRQRYRR